MAGVYQSIIHRNYNRRLRDSLSHQKVKSDGSNGSSNASTIELQLIQLAPIRFSLRVRFFEFDLFDVTNTVAVLVAMRVSWQIQQQVLAHERCEIDRLWPVKLCVYGEAVYSNFVDKFLEA